MLSAGQQVEAGALVRDAWAVVAPLLELTNDEREYVESIARGDARAELLFPDDPTTAERAATHPAILWKLRNVREQLERGA